MAKHNTPRATGRAHTPVTDTRRAATGLGGAAVLGTVLVGTAFAGTPAEAAPAAPAPAPATQTAPAAPSTTAPTTALHSSEKLRWSSRGDAVSDLQSALNNNGCNRVVHGVLGPLTDTSLHDHQHSNAPR